MSYRGAAQLLLDELNKPDPEGGTEFWRGYNHALQEWAHRFEEHADEIGEEHERA